VVSDPGTPLITWDQMTQGAFANLVRNIVDPAAQNDLLLEGGRLCESYCDRRFIPFTGLVETQRADALDVEDALDAYVPLDPTSQLGFSRAASLGSTLLVRHYWVREAPPRYQEMWTGSISQILLRRSFSGEQDVVSSTWQYEPDTGHVRFQLGTFVPPGTTILTTYAGGYSSTPAQLARANKFMTAAIALRELRPENQTSHDPKLLTEEAQAILDRGWVRGGRGNK
jgi:hypothetical protein